MIDKYFNMIKNRAPSFIRTLSKDFIDVFNPKAGANGRPILVIPGFTTSDYSTIILRGSMFAAGFNPYTWDHGTNLIASDDLLQSLLAHLRNIYKEHKVPVTIVGWSMGGFYARALAYMDPDIVNSVITLGTPFKKELDVEELRKKYQKIGIDIDDYPLNPQTIEDIKKTPIVPFTSIYSQADFLAPPIDSMEIETPISENIEVQTGHFGFGCDPESLKIILNRCLEDKTTWKKYKN